MYLCETSNKPGTRIEGESRLVMYNGCRLFHTLAGGVTGYLHLSLTDGVLKHRWRRQDGYSVCPNGLPSFEGCRKFAHLRTQFYLVSRAMIEETRKISPLPRGFLCKVRPGEKLQTSD